MTTPARSAPPTWRAEELCAGADEARITLGTEVFTLRITRAGKLLLTK